MYHEIAIAALYDYVMVLNEFNATYIFTEKKNDMCLQFKIEQCKITKKCYFYENDIKEEMTFAEAINKIYDKTFKQRNNF
jgi:hypothetical protein